MGKDKFRRPGRNTRYNANARARQLSNGPFEGKWGSNMATSDYNRSFPLDSAENSPNISTNFGRPLLFPGGSMHSQSFGSQEQFPTPYNTDRNFEQNHFLDRPSVNQSSTFNSGNLENQNNQNFFNKHNNFNNYGDSTFEVKQQPLLGNYHTEKRNDIIDRFIHNSKLLSSTPTQTFGQKSSFPETQNPLFNLLNMPLFNDPHINNFPKKTQHELDFDRNINNTSRHSGNHINDLRQYTGNSSNHDREYHNSRIEQEDGYKNDRYERRNKSSSRDSYFKDNKFNSIINNSAFASESNEFVEKSRSKLWNNNDHFNHREDKIPNFFNAYKPTKSINEKIQASEKNKLEDKDSSDTEKNEDLRIHLLRSKQQKIEEQLYELERKSKETDRKLSLLQNKPLYKY